MALDRVLVRDYLVLVSSFFLDISFLSISTSSIMGGLLPNFFVLKIKGVNGGWIYGGSSTALFCFRFFHKLPLRKNSSSWPSRDLENAVGNPPINLITIVKFRHAFPFVRFS